MHVVEKLTPKKVQGWNLDDTSGGFVPFEEKKSLFVRVLEQSGDLDHETFDYCGNCDSLFTSK